MKIYRMKRVGVLGSNHTGSKVDRNQRLQFQRRQSGTNVDGA